MGREVRRAEFKKRRRRSDRDHHCCSHSHSRDRHCCSHSHSRRRNETVSQHGSQESDIFQGNEELIKVIDSCGVTVDTTTNQVAVSLQAALQVGIALVVHLTIADGDRAERVTQDLLQTATIRQSSKQKTIIENSEDVEVTTEDTNAAVSINVLLQVLLALVIELDLF